MTTRVPDTPMPFGAAYFLKPGVLVTDLRSGDNPEGEQTYPYFDENGELQEMPLTVAQEWAQRVAAANNNLREIHDRNT